ncbi:MAG: peptide ABC transporter substrate-binding protein [Chloroflexi bacterium]|nr:peptide ABC transporter substrate-binding protein [Chloroflexota bacterium]
MKKFSILFALGLLVALVACGAPTPTAAPTTAPAIQPTTAPVVQPTTPPAVQPTAAPTAAPTKPPAPTGPQILRLGRGTYPDVIDPQRSSYGIEIEVLKLCYEGLTALDNKGNIGPGAADKWTIAPDGKSMTFHIRDGLKRADGTAMNASDYEYALKREVDPRVKDKQYMDIVNNIAGADDLIAKEGEKLADADLAKLYAAYGVKADDAKRELTVTFTAPIGFWHYIAYTWVTYPTDKKTSEANQETWWTKADGHKCNGAYTIKSIEEGKRITYEANANYWRGKPKIDRIVATYETDEIKRFEAYKKDEVDEIDVTSAFLDQVNADAKLKAEFVRYPAAITSMIAYNNAIAPFTDKNVRIAFSQAFDREGWVRDVLKGIGKPYTRWVPPGVPGALPDVEGAPKTDQKAAVETLLKNGYGTADGKKIDCAKLGALKITYSGTAQNHARFQFLAGNFVKVFNCAVTLDPVDATVMTALTKDPKTNPQLSRQGWIQDYPHPQNWLSVYWKCAAFAKRYSYCNKDLDAQLAKADQTLDFDASIKEYQKAEAMLLGDVPGAPSNYSENLYLIKPWLTGLKENPSSSDAEWAGEWGPVWNYTVDLTKVPASYPKQ